MRNGIEPTKAQIDLLKLLTENEERFLIYLDAQVYFGFFPTLYKDYKIKGIQPKSLRALEEFGAVELMGVSEFAQRSKNDTWLARAKVYRISERGRTMLEFWQAQKC